MTTEVSILPIQSVYSIDNRTITAEVLHEEPLIVKFLNVLSDEECQNLIDCASSRLERSKLAKKEISSIRTSSGMFFEENENSLISEIEKRISSLMHLPIEHAEGLQVLHYEPGQEFKPHFDFFGPNHPSSSNNRISTLVVYLNDVEEGGVTTFPNLGIVNVPKKGTAVYFEYFYNDQKLNELTLHSGEPVIQGEKWVATQWMRKKQIRERL
ncbi:2OG-Fe(II) oxygenase [Solibacillus sp. FSL K6-1126]|uniref:2OG-Fe(II) oxygenase n=1 Tax=Solibacillus sp. FSL K6-1126 TaxID=2921463 RepID=UPI0030F7DA40